jgi:hypothetical protein
MFNNKKQISILAIVAVTSFMGTFLISPVNIALPAIENSFSVISATGIYFSYYRGQITRQNK